MNNEFLGNFNEHEKNNITRIKKTYFSDESINTMCSFEGFCFLLGAGASVEAGLPQWGELVKGLCDQYGLNINVDKNKVVEIVGAIETKIIERLSQNPVYKDIEKYISNLNNYDDIRRVLYRTEVKRSIALYVRKILRKAKCSSTSKGLMNTIATICCKRAETCLRTSVITYNYDDYLEFCMHDIIDSLSFPENTPEEEQEKIKQGQKNKIRVHDFIDKQLPCVRQHECSGTDIYHVHGHLDIFIREAEKSDEIPLPRCNEGIVLSSDDYFELSENGALSWTNQVQHSMFSSMPIIVVGFSMDDSNFRLIIRKLQQAKMMRQNIIIFVGHNGTKEKIKEAETGKMLLKELLKGSVAQNGVPQKEMVDVVVCHYDDIPSVLRFFFDSYF